MTARLATSFYNLRFRSIFRKSRSCIFQPVFRISVEFNSTFAKRQTIVYFNTVTHYPRLLRNQNIMDIKIHDLTQQRSQRKTFYPPSFLESSHKYVQLRLNSQLNKLIGYIVKAGYIVVCNSAANRKHLLLCYRRYFYPHLRAPEAGLTPSLLKEKLFNNLKVKMWTQH